MIFDRKREALELELARAHSLIAELQEDLTDAAKALAFYAEPGNWDTVVLRDGGRTARAALGAG